MEKQRRNLTLSLFYVGVFFILAGYLNSMLLIFDFYQKLISDLPSSISNISGILSVVVFFFGFYLFTHPLKAAQRIEDFFEESIPEKFLFFGGCLLIIIGFGIPLTFHFNYRLEFSWVSLIISFAALAVSFILVCCGFIIFRLRTTITDEIAKLFER